MTSTAAKKLGFTRHRTVVLASDPDFDGLLLNEMTTRVGGALIIAGVVILEVEDHELQSVVCYPLHAEASSTGAALLNDGVLSQCDFPGKVPLESRALETNLTAVDGDSGTSHLNEWSCWCQEQLLKGQHRS